jgi:putative endonuclease
VARHTQFPLLVNVAGLAMMYYFYIIRSKKNRRLYLGQTTNLKDRVRSHNDGENKATKPNIPYELIFYSGFVNQVDAINCEHYFKTTAGWKRLHRMLESTLSEK